MATLARGDIQLALERLADELADTGQKRVLVVMGGAALVLLYGARETTRDVDAFVLGGSDPDLRAVAQ